MAMLSLDSQQKVEDLLISQKLLTTEELAKAKKDAAAASQPLLASLVEKKLIDSEELTKIIAKATNIPYVNLRTASIEPKTIAMVPHEVAEQFMAVPLE